MAKRPFDPRLARVPVVRRGLVASVALGLVPVGGAVAQAVGLAHLIAGAMRPASAAHWVPWLVLVASGFALQALAALAGDVVAAYTTSAAKAGLRSHLVAAAVRSRSSPPVATGGSPGRARPHAPPLAPGEVAVLAGPGLDALDVYVSRCLPDLVLAVAAPVALLAAVGALDWVSFLVMAVTLVLFPVFGALAGRSSLALGAERWRRVEQLGAYLADVFQGMPVLRAFGRSGDQRERLAELNRSLSRSTALALRSAFVSALVLDTLASLSVALVAVPLGLRLLTGGVSLPAALAVLVVAPEVFVPVRRATAEFHESAEGLAAMGRILAVAAIPGAGTVAEADVAARWPNGAGAAPRSPAAPRTGAARRAEPGTAPGPRRVAPDPKEVAVALCGVNVSFPGRAEPVLEGADLVIAPGEVVALVGPSGAGKSTVVSLLAGFQVPSRGAVTVGGLDLAEVDLPSWHRWLAYLPEHPGFLPATVADNLRVARPGAPEEELYRALAEVGAIELVERWPGKLKARLGAGGLRLSAGERQRLALARALLRPASLYLLDEPTVHLDEAGEGQALAGLRRSVQGRSALIVSHRPAVAQVADRVVALRERRLVEVSAAELSARVRS